VTVVDYILGIISLFMCVFLFTCIFKALTILLRDVLSYCLEFWKTDSRLSNFVFRFDIATAIATAIETAIETAIAKRPLRPPKRPHSGFYSYRSWCCGYWPLKNLPCILLLLLPSIHCWDVQDVSKFRLTSGRRSLICWL
jgi:hypothetical protein